MGNWFQTLVDIEATADEAAVLGKSLIDWLLHTGVIAGEPSNDCVLGGDGYRPGERYATALADPSEDWFLGPGVNGVRATTESNVFHAGQLGVHVECPRCQNEVDFEDAIVPGIDDWLFDGGTGIRPCPGCGTRFTLNGWNWQPPWAFGYLGLEFWNWPLLSKQFIASVGERLGHRLVVVEGKV
ncbi:MAG: zinc-ribbon domain-containing protein [Streptosporangiales bacterium]|nr:zinc-ribbon domain-containing protein [Streptosporangiales bacterium]